MRSQSRLTVRSSLGGWFNRKLSLVLLLAIALLFGCELVGNRNIVKNNAVSSREQAINPQIVALQPQFDAARTFSAGLAAVKIGRKFGYIDKTGKFIIRKQFDVAQPFSSGLAAVKMGRKWGYIDITGKLVIQPQFDQANDFSSDISALKIC